MAIEAAGMPTALDAAHILLGLQILIGGLLGGLGLYLINYAFAKGNAIQIDTGSYCLIGGIAAVIVGILLISGINLMYFGVLFQQ